jgi:translation initiation factor 2B subunit (eIF-2B alpha/beta/delta family)
MVLVGAEAVVENGGVINKVITMQLFIINVINIKIFR